MSNRNIDHNEGCLGDQTAFNGHLLYAEQINYESSTQFYYWAKCNKKQITNKFTNLNRVAVFKLKQKKNE